MKKKILIGVGILVLFFVCVIGYMVVSDLNEEKKLKLELTKVSEMMDIKNSKKVYERLNRIVTTGDYGKVEKAFKNYLKDILTNLEGLSTLINDDKIESLLTIDNYKKDGKDFFETKKYIVLTKSQLEKYKLEYKEFLTTNKAMSYIEKENVDSYYVDLYKDEYIDDIKNDISDKNIENSIDELLDLLNVSEEIINFLSQNQNRWEISGDKIMFDNDELVNKYNDLISKLS